MSLVIPVLFCLTWSATVWAISAVVSRTAHARPALWLALVAAAVVPSVLVIADLAWPVSAPPSFLITESVADRGVLEFVASIEQIAGPSPRLGFDWVFTLTLTAYLAGLLVHIAKAVRSGRYLRTCIEGAMPLGGFKSQWPLLVAKAARSPLAIGVRRPVIVLPQTMALDWPAERLALVIAHEENHLQHRDPAIAICMVFVAALFWFNPFLRDLIAGWRQACELRADTAVLKHTSSNTRIDYAEALLEALKMHAGPVPHGLSPSFTTRNLRSEKMRFSMIRNGGFKFSENRTARGIAFLGVAVLTLAGTLGALTAASTVDAVERNGDFIEGGRLVSPFGVKRKNLRIHTGVDIAARKGAAITAPGDATVLQATDLFRGEWRFGKAVVLQFDEDLIAWFTHLDTYTVKPGDRIRKGEQFATVGNTGLSKKAHVHIETYQGPSRVRVDPETIWDFCSAKNC